VRVILYVSSLLLFQIRTSMKLKSMNFSCFLIPVIKNELFASMLRNEDRPSGSTTFWSAISRTDWFASPRRRSFVIRQNLQRIWKDLHHRDAGRLRSKREDRHMGPVRICVDFADFRLTEKCFMLATFSLQLQYLVACRMNFLQKEGNDLISCGN